MPIPNYLRDIAYRENNKNNFTTFYLKCVCGYTLFDVYESYLDKKEKELCQPYYDALSYSVTGGYFSNCTKDENGNIHRWIYLTHSRNGPRKEVIIPPAPVFAHIKAIKVKCSECGKEYTIYDNRYNGYSGMFSNRCSEKEKSYIPHFKLKKRRDNSSVEICINVEHDESFEAFKANTNLDCSFNEYTDAYTWITIYSIDNNLKKRKLFEFETD